MVTVFSILLLVSAITLIVTVLMQESSSEGMGAIAGGAETIWGKNKSNSKDAMLARLTTIAAVIFMVSAVAIAAIQ